MKCFAGVIVPLVLVSCAGRGEEVSGPCRVLADKQLEEPLGAIVGEYSRLTGAPIKLDFLPGFGTDGYDAVFRMKEPLPGGKKVAWKHPSGEPVWAVALTGHLDAKDLVRFAGGPTGHRLWSESKAGFTIVSGEASSAHEWVAEHRVKHTYPMTAMRMLGECGGIRDGILIDIGCGPGHLEVELAKRSRFKIIGLDIDEGAKPGFEKRMREAGLQERVSFVAGDAQKLPFPDAYADVIVSRGTLVFIPDLKKCLREVGRVLKPTGVAFLGGRYIYTPHVHKMTVEKLKKIVKESGVSGARVVGGNGQWVKIIGPKAPEEAQRFQGGPHMLASRIVAEYGITEGRCLFLGGDGLRKGLEEWSGLEVVTLEKATLGGLPFEEASFDLIVGTSPMLILEKDRVKAMREIFRVLRKGGAARIGGRFSGMPEARRVSSEALRKEAAKTGITSIRVIDVGGQWVEIRKGIRLRD